MRGGGGEWRCAALLAFVASDGMPFFISGRGVVGAGVGGRGLGEVRYGMVLYRGFVCSIVAVSLSRRSLLAEARKGGWGGLWLVDCKRERERERERTNGFISDRSIASCSLMPKGNRERRRKGKSPYSVVLLLAATGL